MFEHVLTARSAPYGQGATMTTDAFPARDGAPWAGAGQRAIAMYRNANQTFAQVDKMYRRFLSDACSALDRPLLADDTDGRTAQLYLAAAGAQQALGQARIHGAVACPAALAAAEATRYAFTVADNHARRAARHGIYPGGLILGVADQIGLAQARAHLRLAARSRCAGRAAHHRTCAVTLVSAVGLVIPQRLRPAWRNVCAGTPAAS